MSARSVWTTMAAAGLTLASVGVACAQSYGYGGNGYPDRYWFEQDQDRGYGGGSVYRPFDYRYDNRYEAPRSYNGYDAPRAGGGPQYVDPYDGGRDRAGGPASDAELGATIDRRTMTEVENDTHQPPGTIVIDTASRHLYYTQANGRALRYGIGVGREGFTWKGVAKIERKAQWPDWIPPSDMLKRRPDLPLRMSGGIDNPLGARALYLFKGSKDTMFRIHGTNEPDTIGQAVSSGCIRMMNGDVIDLYNRVPVGTKVVVL